MRPRDFAILIAMSGAILGPTTAVGHVTANPDAAPAGTYFRTAFRVTHGCEGSPTVAVRVEVPDTVHWIKPEAKPGWDITVKTRDLDEPVEVGELTLNETVEEIVWRGGQLADAHFDEFGLTMKAPTEPGKTLYFPTVQECRTGTNEWTTIPSSVEQWHSVDEPAPFIRLIDADGSH